MKLKAVVSVAIASCVLSLTPAQAQSTKAPSQYFPKNYPAPTKAGGPAQGQRPAQGQGYGQNRNNQQTPAAAAVPQRPKFKDVPLNSQFFFMSDTNRAFAWTKVSPTSAKNNKTGVVRALSGETPIAR